MDKEHKQEARSGFCLSHMPGFLCPAPFVARRTFSGFRPSLQGWLWSTRPSEGWGDLHSTGKEGLERLGLRSAQEHKDRLGQPRNPRLCSPSVTTFQQALQRPPTRVLGWHRCVAETRVPACSPMETEPEWKLIFKQRNGVAWRKIRCLRCWGYRFWVYIPSLAVLITQPSSLLSKVRRPPSGRLALSH